VRGGVVSEIKWVWLMEGFNGKKRALRLRQFRRAFKNYEDTWCKRIRREE